MSSSRVILLLVVSIAYTLNLLVAQGPTEEEQQARMNDWFNTKKHPPLNLSKEDEEYLRSGYVKPAGPQTLAAETVLPRSECRFMSRQRWNDYVKAWGLWHNMKAPGSTSTVTQHHLYCSQHQSSVAPGAHFGPCFLPWHREYLNRWEGALRKHVANASLCYINWSLDRWMPNSCDSVTFSPDHFGSPSGDVLNGFAANWQLSSGCNGRVSGSKRLWRNCIAGLTGRSYLPTETTMNTFINYKTYGDFCAPNFKTFENAHGNVHAFVGGTMNSITCSPNDPIFVSHHSGVDRLWQRHRDKLGAVKETQYPTWSTIKAASYANATAKPFDPMKCSDGLKVTYDNAIKYEDVPSTCTTQAACGNGDGKGALWCNTSTGKCNSKLKIGGNCTVSGVTDIVCYTELRCATTAKCAPIKTGSTIKACNCTLKATG